MAAGPGWPAPARLRPPDSGPLLPRRGASSLASRVTCRGARTCRGDERLSRGCPRPASGAGRPPSAAARHRAAPLLARHVRDADGGRARLLGRNCQEPDRTRSRHLARTTRRCSPRDQGVVMTDLKAQLARLLDNEPEPPYDVDRAVRSGRGALRRRNAAVATAGALGAAGVATAVVVPALIAGHSGTPVSLGVQPSPSPTPSKPHCYLIAVPAKAEKLTIARLLRSRPLNGQPSVRFVEKKARGTKRVLEVCSGGTAPVAAPNSPAASPASPTSPAYAYTEKPSAIAARLGTHLRERVTGFDLSITYTRPFSQESSTLEGGRPSYFGGNVDVHEAKGYADIGVQVTHATTGLVPFDGPCAEAEHCTETRLPDGSVLRTGQVEAGPGDVVVTAEVHRPDGVVVMAQESNYPFGPDAGSQAHGEQPLALDALVGLAEDKDFTF